MYIYKDPPWTVKPHVIQKQPPNIYFCPGKRKEGRGWVRKEKWALYEGNLPSWKPHNPGWGTDRAGDSDVPRLAMPPPRGTYPSYHHHMPHPRLQLHRGLLLLWLNDGGIVLCSIALSVLTVGDGGFGLPQIKPRVLVTLFISVYFTDGITFRPLENLLRA